MFQRHRGERTVKKMTIRILAMAVLLVCIQSAVSAPIARGSLSPAAPVNLDYRIAHTVVAGQQNSVSVEISTRLDHGSLLVEIAKQQGVTIATALQCRFDLAHAVRPIKFDLPILPADQSERFLILLLTVDTEMGLMSRSFRIDLSDPPADGGAP